MSPRRVRVLRRAQGDLLEIRRYVERESPDTADRIVDRLLDSIASLQTTAERGFVPHDARLKGLVLRILVSAAPHLIFYEVRGREVRIYRVLHGRRSYLELLRARRSSVSSSPSACCRPLGMKRRYRK